MTEYEVIGKNGEHMPLGAQVSGMRFLLFAKIREANFMIRREAKFYMTIADYKRFGDEVFDTDTGEIMTWNDFISNVVMKNHNGRLWTQTGERVIISTLHYDVQMPTQSDLEFVDD